jgi:feruloyl esterase
VLNYIGDKATKEFYKLYMIPGLFHCSGGVGCSDDKALFDALVNWVEKGVEPKSVTGSRIVDGKLVRTRPMCPYPSVAKYTGTGSIDDAKNYTCE